VEPNTRAAIVAAEGRGELDGLLLFIQGVSTTDMDQWIAITIDDRKVEAWTQALLGALTRPGKVDTPTKPATVYHYDTTNKWYGYSLTSPIKFAKNLKVEYWNNGSNGVHYVSFLAVLHLEL
jgi:hypothetical protein